MQRKKKPVYRHPSGSPFAREEDLLFWRRGDTEIKKERERENEKERKKERRKWKESV